MNARHDGGPPGAGRRQGHLGRHAVRRARRRPRVGLQADARRPRVRLGHHRPRHRRDPGDGPGARRGRRADRRRVRRHPATDFGPHRRADHQAGDEPAHPRGRAGDEVRGVRRPRGRHRHRHHPADRRAATRCSTSAGSRRCCPRPSRCPTSAPSPAPGSRPTSSRSARPPRAPRSWSAAPTPASSSGCSSSRCPRSPTASSRSRPAPVSPGPHQDRRVVERPQRRPGRRLRRRPWRPRAHGRQRAARREDRHRPVLRRPADFVAKALSPAKVKEVRIDEDTGTAEVIVPDYQLSLAIGKEGQNARLAARLTGWRVDIKSETQLAEEEAYANQDWAEGEWVVDPETGEQVWQPAEGGEAMSVEAVAQASRGAGRRRRCRASEADVESRRALRPTVIRPRRRPHRGRRWRRRETGRRRGRCGRRRRGAAAEVRRRAKPPSRPLRWMPRLRAAPSRP